MRQRDPMEMVVCVDATPQPPRDYLEELLRSGCRLAEARLDLLQWSPEETGWFIREAAEQGIRVIATLRCSREGGAWQGPPEEKQMILTRALQAGAWLVDIEYRSPLLDTMLATGRALASIHLPYTPWPEILYALAGDMLRRGARVAKIVTTARRLEDNWRLLGINTKWPHRVTAFAMGDRGRLSRILAPLMGAAFTYASVGKPTAPGQVTLRQLLETWRQLGVLPGDS